MAEREASVKLTLDGAQFMVAIKRVGDGVDNAGKRGKKSMDLLGAGAKSARKHLADLGGALKNTLSMAAGLGGAFTVGNAVKQAVKLRSSYETLAFAVKTGTGRMMHAADVQRIVEQSAARTARTNEEMAGTFEALWNATGDADFARDALDAVGTTATATGTDLDTLASMADQLHTKFGVGAAGMKDAMAQVFEASKKGGPSFSEFADVMSSVGAELLAAGLDGQRGLDFMLGALVQTDDKMKSLPKQVSGLKAVLRGLGNQSDLKKLGERLGISGKDLINEKDAIARLRRVLTKGKKGVDALLGGMNEGEEKQAMQILFTDPFEKALADANASGLKGKAAVDRALLTFDTQIRDFGKATLTGTQLQREATRRAQEPEAQLRTALDRLNTAFSQPEIINAINELSKHLPALAKVVGDVVAFAAKNPLAAGAIGIGAKAGGGFLSGMAGEAIKGLGKRVLGGAAASAAGSAAAGAAGAGAAGAAGAGAAAAAGGAGVVGSAMAAGPIVAAIAAGGLLIGEQIGNAFDEERDVMGELANATAAGFNGGQNLEQLKATLDRLQAARTGVMKADVGGGVMDWLGKTVTGVDTKAQADEALKLSMDAIQRVNARIAQLEGGSFSSGTPAAPGTSATPTKPKPVALDSTAPKMIAAATATAMGGTVLTVRLARGSENGLGRASPGPGGSRGPMAAGPVKPGGAV